MKISNKHCVVFDIETTTQKEYYKEMSEKAIELWEKRCHLRYPEFYGSLPMQFQSQTDVFYQNIWEKKGTYVPEFSKIVCISVGTLNKAEEFVTMTYSGDEKDIIQNFFNLCHSLFPSKKEYLIGHNIKNFDISYLLKRALANGFSYEDFPEILQLREKKPWEMSSIIDTKELYNFGSNMHFHTLDEACMLMEIPSPKEEVGGDKVYRYYYTHRLDEIEKYCENDVRATWEFFQRLK